MALETVPWIRTRVRTLIDVTRRLSGFRDFRSLVENDDPPRPAARETAPAPSADLSTNSGAPPEAAKATVTDQRVRTRFVMVHTEAGERPGLILEWVKVHGAWTARVAYVVDDNATMVVEWVEAVALAPVETTQ